MKTGKSLSELAMQLERDADLKHDYVAETTAMFMTTDTAELLIPSEDVASRPTDHCHRQIATYTGIGTKYYEKMRQDSPELLAGNVNHWLHKEQEKQPRRMIRTMDGNARAFLSDHYLRVDNEHVAEVALTVFNDVPELEVVSCDVTDTKLYIKAVFPRTEAEVKVGDSVQSGVVVSNSEIGTGRFRVDPFWYRLWCLNGCASMQTEKGFSRIHRGAKIQNDGIVYQQDTVEAAAQALLLQCRDAVTQFADPGYFSGFVDKLKESTETMKLERPVQAVEKLAKTIGLTKDEGESVLERLIREGDYTKYGMLNAVTNLANDVESYDRATELEYAGGLVLDLPRTQWERIAEAA
jgi:hypothetical protein